MLEVENGQKSERRSLEALWSGHNEDFQLSPKLFMGFEEGWHMLRFEILKHCSYSSVGNGW